MRQHDRLQKMLPGRSRVPAHHVAFLLQCLDQGAMRVGKPRQTDGFALLP